MYKTYSDKSATPTWDDTDLFEMVSNSDWLLLSTCFSVILTLKHAQEYGRSLVWLPLWIFSVPSMISFPLCLVIYKNSSATSRLVSLVESVFQVVVYFLIIRVLEKSDLKDKGEWERRRQAELMEESSSAGRRRRMTTDSTKSRSRRRNKN